MTTPKAVFAGLILVAAAIYFGSISTPAIGQATPGSNFGPWNMKEVKKAEAVWKLNSATGDLFLCMEKTCVKLESK